MDADLGIALAVGFAVLVCGLALPKPFSAPVTVLGLGLCAAVLVAGWVS